MLGRTKAWAKKLKIDAHAIWLAARDPRVPWFVKALAIAVAAYALSPIDLIPDFVPVLGYLDDLVIVPLGIWLVVALMPDDVMAECRIKAREAAGRPTSIAGLVVVIGVWIAGALLMGWLGYRYWTAELEPVRT
jgi:uncharacterized membrane protein YkvA (DUF1232 family)